MELANPRVSPMNYTFERERIDSEVSKGDSSLVMRDRWIQKSGALFREREPGKELQPIMVFSHRSDGERINTVIDRNPVMPLQVSCTHAHHTTTSLVSDVQEVARDSLLLFWNFVSNHHINHSHGHALTTQSTANFVAQCSLTNS